LFVEGPHGREKKMRVAAVTMAYNEPEYVPIWVRYYGGAVGREHCYIIDHGTDDRSTDGLVGVNVVRIPRSPKDNVKRTRFISVFVSSLLEWYDAVLCIDIDEIVIADPRVFPSLLDYIEKTSVPIVNAIGFDVWHVPEIEAGLELRDPVLWQRHWMRFSSSMCKPVLTRRPTRWAPGFHSADAKLTFDALYLFHLRYFDYDLALRRLSRTRSMTWAHENAGSHQRLPDAEFHNLFTRGARMKRLSSIDVAPDSEYVTRYLAKVLSSEKEPKPGDYNLDLHIFGSELIQIPEYFANSV